MGDETTGRSLKKFDLVSGPPDIKIGVIISDPFTANFFDSNSAKDPFDIADPEAYEIKVEMVLVYVFVPGFKGAEAVRLDNLRLSDLNPLDAHVYFDCATDKLREMLSVKKFAENL